MSDLEWLINRYIDGLASSEEVASLNELLRNDRTARLVFAEHLNLDSSLAEIAAGLPGKHAAVEDIVLINEKAVFSNAVAYSLTAVATAVVFSVAAWLWVARMHYAEQATVPLSSNQASLQTPSTPVAILIDEAGAEFALGRSPRDKRLECGDYELIAGVAHIRFAQGAELILASPARWTIVDSMHVQLEHGKVRVIAPPSAKGFSVLTSDAEYIDLGTEFGLDVDQRGQASDLYVFDGQVNVADSKSKQIVDEIVEGGSKRYRQGVAEPAPKLNSQDFPTPNQIGLVRWRHHIEHLRQDPGLIAFFPFRRTEDASILVNEMGESSPFIQHGTIVGARWVSGRWPGKDSLLFDGDSERVDLNIPGEYKEYTIAAWIKIDRLDYEMNAILNSDELQDGDVHFQITRQGLPKGGVQGSVTGSITNDVFIGDALPIGKWVHVAMVIASNDHTRSVYANGKLVRKGVMNHPVTIRPGSCRLGNWLPFDGQREKRTRAFRGRIDELAIWNRALIESELRELVASGRQNADTFD